MVHSESRDPLVKSVHHIHHSSSTKQFVFSASNKPIRTIPSGTTVTFDNTEAGFNKINSTSTTADLAAFDIQSLSDIERIFGPIYVDGPIYIADAEPGDVLKIEILSLQTGLWGWTAILPGLGLFKDEITGPYLKTFPLRTKDDEQRDYVVFKEGKVRIPARPFYGTMGVAPVAEKGDVHPLFPRDDIGGNFDCRYWGVGSTVFLRVNVKGALFSVGDAHYTQGDGEITGTALETTMRSSIRLTIIKPDSPNHHPLSSPHYTTNPVKHSVAATELNKGDYGVLSTASTRDEAVKNAVRGVMGWMQREHKLSREEAYTLFSLVGDLKTMHDLGLELFTNSASVPLGVFVG